MDANVSHALDAYLSALCVNGYVDECTRVRVISYMILDELRDLPCVCGKDIDMMQESLADGCMIPFKTIDDEHIRTTCLHGKRYS